MKKIIFQVVEVNKKKLFQVSSKKKILFFNKLLAVWFEGYHYNTKFQIIRNGESYENGYVNYYGIHAASEFFFLNEHMIDEICAEQLELGDILEMENINKTNYRYYASFNDFMKCVIAFEKVSKKLDQAFTEYDNELSREEFIQTLISCSKGISWEDRMKKVSIIRL